jgi:hypothetical protein
MRWIAREDGNVWQSYGPDEDIPQRLISRERKAARRELATDLYRSRVPIGQIDELVNRVVTPERVDRALEERERIAAGPDPVAAQRARELVERINERRAKARAQGSDDGMEASA